MIVSETRLFVFLHNPKAGGTSIRNALLPWDTRNNFFWGIAYDSATGWNVDKAHLPLHVLGRLYPEVRELMSRAVTFGFSRHPIRRFVSSFNERFPQIYEAMSTGSISADEYSGNLERYAQDVVAGGEWNPNFTHATPQKPLFFEGRKAVADLIIPIEAPFPKVRVLSSWLGAPGAAIVDCFDGNAEKMNARTIERDIKSLLSPQTYRSLADFYAEDFLVLGYDE